ncbi:MAG: Fe-S protein assembly co-chaperone HscB [Bryobacterales bacterium]|nr:Fe-S protein assembly co-chaperone HscB [Bryobacterales bacterium]
MHQFIPKNGSNGNRGELPAEIRTQVESASPDFYAMFSQREVLAVDLDELQSLFYDLSRQLHPDRFARAAEAERELSLRASSLLNDAYRTLRDPLKRAEYVLSRHGFDPGESRSKSVPPELLEEVFELNMALEELRAGDEDAREGLESAQADFEAMRAQIDTGLTDAFTRWDAARQAAEGSDSEESRAVLAEIRGSLDRRRYIQNLLRDVQAALSGPAA